MYSTNRCLASDPLYKGCSRNSSLHSRETEYGRKLYGWHQVISGSIATGDPAHLAGLAAGIACAQAAGRSGVRCVITNTGLMKIAVGDKFAALKIDTITIGSANNQDSDILTGLTRSPFGFLAPSGRPISNAIFVPSTGMKCLHDQQIGHETQCRFCEATIHLHLEPFYHCCDCASRFDEAFSFCEICVAGRGCNCPGKGHVLFRKGFLTTEINVGDTLQYEGK